MYSKPIFNQSTCKKGSFALKNHFVLIWDEDDSVVFSSNELMELLKINAKRDELKWTDIIEEHLIEAIKDHFSSSSETFVLTDIQLKTIDEQNLYVGFVEESIHNGKYIYICEIVTKGTSEEMQQYLMNTEKLISSSKIAAGVVHEIRNPLTSLKGFLQLLQAGISQKEEFYHVMIKEVDKLEMLANELLQLSKPSNQTMKDEKVNHLIGEVVYLLENQTTMRNIEINVHAEDNIEINCNAMEIKLVFINLIKNAAEAMDYRGNIQIKVTEDKNNAQINVIDSGSGIDEMEIEKLSQAFYTTKTYGTGLGLSVAQTILTKHQAKMFVKRNEFKGATFSIVIPLI